MARILRLPQVTEAVRLSRSTIYNLVKKGEFPSPVKLSVRASGWLESDISNWIDSRHALSVKEG